MDELNTLNEALRLAGLGWHLFPLRAGAKTPRIKWRDEATTDPDRLREWFSKGGLSNIGLAIPEGAMVLDIDPDGLAEFGGLAEAFDGPKARTPRGGWHLYCRAPEGVIVKNQAGQIAPGLDTRTIGGYVVAAPSTIDGRRYEWAEPLAVSPADLPACPGWLADRLRGLDRSTQEARESSPRQKSRQDQESESLNPPTTPKPSHKSYGETALRCECAKVNSAPEGTRNNQLNESALKVARLVAGGHLDESDARGALLEAALAAGLDERESAATIESGFREGLKHPRTPAPRGTATQSTADEGNEDSTGEPASEKASAAELAVRLALELGTLGISTKREPYIVLNGGPNVAHPLAERDGTFRDRLASEFRKRYRRVPGSSALSDAIATLRGDALDLAPSVLALRVAEHGGSVVLDLGSESGEAVVIDAAGWSIVKRAPTLFQRTAADRRTPPPRAWRLAR